MLDATRVARAIDLNSKNAGAMAMLGDLGEVFGLGRLSAFSQAIVLALSDLQRSMGLSIDGVLGPVTQAKITRQGFLLGEPIGALWPALARRPLELARACPGGENLGARPVLFAIRGAYPNATRSHRSIHAPRYDDTFVFVRDGKPELFRGATHAYQLTSSESPDTFKDGVGDVGSVRPGLYLASLRSAGPVPIFAVLMPDGKSDRLPAHRDKDHDGVISAAEAELSERATSGAQVTPGVGTWANAVLIHPGYDTIKPGTGRNFSSIACLTASLSDVHRLASNARHMDVLLLNAADADRVAAGLVAA
jgi:hypothetical protein